RRRHTRFSRDWSSDVCSSDLPDDASAVRLEQLRRSYAPLFAMLGSQGVERESVVQMWTFTIASGASPIFDPGASPPRVPTPTDRSEERRVGKTRRSGRTRSRW